MPLVVVAEVEVEAAFPPVTPLGAVGEEDMMKCEDEISERRGYGWVEVGSIRDQSLIWGSFHRQLASVYEM